MQFGQKAAVAATLFACVGGTGNAAFGELVFDVNPGPAGSNGFTQQSGNAAYLYGESVTLAPSAPRQLQSITVAFTLFTYQSASLQPTINLSLFDVNASGKPIDSNPADTLVYTPIATVIRNDLTFTGSNYNAGGETRDVQQNVTFDFSSLNITLPDNFAFAYRETSAAGQVSPGFGFSVFVSKAGSSDPDGIARGFIQANPNGDGSNVFFDNPAGPYHVESEIVAIPEPFQLGTLALGGLLVRRRGRRA